MKIRKGVYLSQKDSDYIEEIMRENELQSFTAALELIITEHRERSSSRADIIAKRVIDEFDRRHKNELTRIRLASGTGDKNIQTLIEMLNTLLVSQNIGDYFDTNIVPSPAFSEGKEAVKKRIESYKQQKDSKN